MTQRRRVYLDTDVILDFVLRRQPFFVHAAQVLQEGMEGRILLLASAGSLKDVFYFARKATPEEVQRDHKEGNEKRGRESIRLLLQILEACALDKAMWDEALTSPLKDTEDALQLACAARNKADFLVTRNTKHYSGVLHPQVILPDVLLATLKTIREP